MMNNKILFLCLILLIILGSIFPFSTAINYREGSFITINTNRNSINLIAHDAILYNVETVLGLIYVCSWCPDKNYPCNN